MNDKWDDEDFHKAQTERDTFWGALWWKKIIISLSGPIANVVLAVVVFSIMAMIGQDFKTSSNQILLMSDTYDHQETDKGQQIIYPADKAGLKTGDRIVAINNIATATFSEISKEIAKLNAQEMELTIQRGDEKFKTRLKPEYNEKAKRALIGISDYREPVVEKVMKGKLAHKLGLQPGDRIVEFNDRLIRYDIDLDTDLLKQQPFVMEVLRNGETMIFEQGDIKFDPERMSFGISFPGLTLRVAASNPLEAFAMGLKNTGNTFGLIIQGFAKLFSEGVKDATDVFASPIRITHTIGTETLSFFSLGFSEGMFYFFGLICTLSILIGMMNLLPIPALDGGQIILAVILAIGKKNISLKFLYRYQMIGFSIVILLLFLAVFSDIFFFLK